MGNGVLNLELQHAPASGEHPNQANEHEVDEGSRGATDAICQSQSSE
jgi:hypothetical protein